MKKVLVSVVFVLISFIVTLLLFMSKLTSFSIIAGGVFVCSILYFFRCVIDIFDKNSSYEKKLNKFLRDYDAIVVECENMPDVKGKNILFVKNISDLVDAELELRKPIYYYKEEKTCTFVISLNDELLVHVMKKEQTKSMLEKSIKRERIVKDKSLEDTIVAEKAKEIICKVNIEENIENKKIDDLLEATRQIEVLDF